MQFEGSSDILILVLDSAFDLLPRTAATASEGPGHGDGHHEERGSSDER
jgi:hypothetical protein